MKTSLINNNDKHLDNDDKTPVDNVNIRNINYSILFLVIIAIGYSYLFITMAMNTSSMNNNLNKIIDVINIIDFNNVNTTSIDSIHKNLSFITECVVDKYCKRIPS